MPARAYGLGGNVYAPGLKPRKSIHVEGSRLARVYGHEAMAVEEYPDWELRTLAH